ncbi:hypothetical protein POM88_017643 [Heracleum sosnowskyi]|uniref:ATP-dependent DNA helicase n=1 Tax=Heracleum sosnowskyi TaxID=360622 RepID=A0AAD8IPJ9_9APIA|nr:hypothetical protein POM88_017643 [Heracleum sosnowskyi]
MSTTNNDDGSNFMQTQHSTFDHVDQSSNSIPLSDITRKTSNQPQNTREEPSKSGFVDGSGERIPLSNLTNENDAQVFTRERCKPAENPRKVVASKMQRRITPTMDSITKELSFEDDLIHNDYDSAEFSTISDLQADEGDMFWDDEYEFAEVERLDAEENETEHNAVPEGYASLDGYHDEIPYVDSNTQSKKKRKRITMKEYYSYKLQVRKDEGLHVRLAGRLYQQYVVDAFSYDIKKKNYFGTCLGVMYVVEFQKRAVKSLMIHGPCGLQNTKSPCMDKFKCTKHFPKKYCSETHWKHMIDDLLLEKTKAVVNKMTSYSDKQLQYFALAEIDKILKSIGKSLMQFKQLPQPPANYLQSGTNNLVIDETSYNLSEMEFEFNKLFPHCNPEQLEVYTEVFNSVQSNAGGVYFVYGSGGCGKTFVWKTLIYKLRSLGLIVLPVAFSGIAATLMPGGRTAHSRFKIPIVLDDCSSCAIHHDSDIAKLIKRTSLIIWDGAPMQHRYAFECLDRSLRDIMRSVDRTRYNMPFGGITVVLGGDFRQILPVINLGSRGDVVSASITHSRLWLKSKILLLHRNMRLNQGQNSGELESLKRFAEWVLQIGNGQVKPPKNAVMDYEENDIIIPPEFCDPCIENSVENMIQWTYPDFLSNYIVTSPYGLKVFIDDKNAKATNLTKNVVYHEIFYNLPVP